MRCSPFLGKSWRIPGITNASGFLMRTDIVSYEQGANVEMQSRRKKAIAKRSRYYHSQMLMEALDRGIYYEELPDTFVIFICDHDPFGEKRYCYTFRNVCKEQSELELRDGGCTIFQRTIRRVKTSREMGERYMTLEELLREEKEEGRLDAKREAVLELLEEFGELPEDWKLRIGKLEDAAILKNLHKLAARADSLRAFEEASKAYFGS